MKRYLVGNIWVVIGSAQDHRPTQPEQVALLGPRARLPAGPEPQVQGRGGTCGGGRHVQKVLAAGRLLPVRPGQATYWASPGTRPRTQKQRRALPVPDLAPPHHTAAAVPFEGRRPKHRESEHSVWRPTGRQWQQWVPGLSPAQAVLSLELVPISPPSWGTA